MSDKGNSAESSPHYTGHRQRLKGKLLASPDALGDYELLELLLYYAIPRKDVKPIAKALITRFEGLTGVLNADVDSLKTVKGISENSALLIKLLRKLEAKSLFLKLKAKDRLNSPEDVVGFSKKTLAAKKEEAFMIIYINAKNAIIDYEIVNEGTVNKAVVYPRNVIKQALAHNASGIIIVHNHPSGDCDPSANDIHLTGLISKAAEPMDIKLMDHIIVGNNDSFSFADENLL